MRGRMFPALVCLALVLTGCAPRTQVGAAEYMPEGYTLEEQGAYTLSDGVFVDRWHFGYMADDYYRLPDGTDLLLVSEPVGPGNVHTSQEGVQDLSESAREAILAWYEERGLLYDVPKELERAYAQYLQCLETGERYREGMVEQTVFPRGSTQRIISFQTSLTLPTEEPGVVDTDYYNEIFDRETGEKVSVWDLFTVPEEEVRRLLRDAMRPADIADPPEAREAIAAALRPEYIGVYAQNIQIWFPKGTLPEGEVDGWVLYYENYPELLEILQPWAVPEE